LGSIDAELLQGLLDDQFVAAHPGENPELKLPDAR
jgi:hypothetical protein